MSAKTQNLSLAGSLGAILGGRTFISTNPLNYNNICNIALAMATAVGSVIEISDLDPLQGFKIPLLIAIVRSQFEGRFPTSTNPVDYAEEALAIKAVYDQAVTKLAVGP